MTVKQLHEALRQLVISDPCCWDREINVTVFNADGEPGAPTRSGQLVDAFTDDEEGNLYIGCALTNEAE